LLKVSGIRGLICPEGRDADGRRFVNSVAGGNNLTAGRLRVPSVVSVVHCAGILRLSRLVLNVPDKVAGATSLESGRYRCLKFPTK
jgi:hypothetical protein